ncbi:MAG: glycosyltransferase family 4 protein [Bacteroidales bacterium]|nr:glycosyltransferase family 4 protein [Bacteroidales bacterium]MBR4326699.1 glycosyltransferase family 4 protein [Bacteroidales bacterium]
MKVLYIVDPGIVGGATLAFLEIVTQMKLKGVSPLVCTSTYNQLNEILKGKGIESLAIGHNTVIEPISPYKWKRPIKYPIRWIIYRIKLRRAIRTIERNIDLNTIDLIHTNSARNDVGCYINKKYQIPHIVHIREFADADFRCITFRNNFIEVFNKYSTVFISISNAVKKHWEDKGIDSSKNLRIYDGVTFKDIRESYRDEKLKKEIKMVISSGICLAKGQHLILEAINTLPQEIKNNVYVDFIGWADPQYKKYMLNLIKKYSLGKQIRFTGALKNVHPILHNYQIGLMCSRAEGFGRVTAEYMFAELGVIASNSGANPELIEDGKSGLLFESGNAISLANCITKYYNNRELLISCSETAHKKACREYTDEKNADNIYKLYNNILSK